MAVTGPPQSSTRQPPQVTQHQQRQTRRGQQEPTQNSALDRKYNGFAQRFRGSAGGRLGLRVAVFVVGLVFVLTGAVLAVLPGPLTIPPVLAGVYVWSLEFTWARRLRVRVNNSAREAWANAKTHPARASTITVLGLAAAAATVWAVTHYDLIDRLKNAII